MGLGIGLIQKALYIATFGLSGRIFNDDSRKPRPVKAAAQPARTAKPARAAHSGAHKAPRRTTKKARASTGAKRAASGKGTATELKRVAKLHAQGALTDEEFAAAKARILGTSVAAPASSSFPAVEANVAAARQLAELADGDPAPSVATTGNSTLGNG